LPEPLAETVTAVPLALLPNAIAPLLAVVDKAKVPVAVIEPELERAALLDTDTLLPVELPLPILRAVPPVPAQVTLPVVLNVRLLAEPVKVFILPEPEARFRLVVLIDPPI